MSAIVTPPVEETAGKRSAVELIKENSRRLRGTIAQELAGSAEKLGEADKNLLKFHGSYQQEDRDARKLRRARGLGKFHMFMVRCKIPGGRLTAGQYLAVDELAGAHANGTLRFTTRQGIQLHGVLKGHLKDTIAGIPQDAAVKTGESLGTHVLLKLAQLVQFAFRPELAGEKLTRPRPHPK